MKKIQMSALALTFLVSATQMAVAESNVVRLGAVPVPPMGALYIGLEKNYFADQGIDIELTKTPLGPTLMSQLIGGNLDVVGLGIGAGFFNAVKKGAPIKIVAPMGGNPSQPGVQVGTSAASLMVRTDLLASGEVKNEADLKGKTCAINSLGVLTEYIMTEELARGGLTISDIKLKTMPFPQIAAALKSKALDCGLLPPALTVKVMKQKVAKRLHKDYELGMQGLVIIYNTKWAKANPETANKFMAGYLMAVRDLQTDNGWRNDKNIAILAKHIKMPKKIMKKINQQWIDIATLKVNKENLMKQQNYYVDHSKAVKFKKPLAFSAIVDESYADHAVANAETVAAATKILQDKRIAVKKAKVQAEAKRIADEKAKAEAEAQAEAKRTKDANKPWYKFY